MADNNGAGVGTGLVAGILLVALIAFFTGGLDFKGSKDVDINIEGTGNGREITSA